MGELLSACPSLTMSYDKAVNLARQFHDKIATRKAIPLIVCHIADTKGS
jgi:hypothetical protein